MSFTTHHSLLDGLRRNDDAVWERFCRTYRPLLRLHGRDCGVPESLMDDLGQEVLRALSEKRAVMNFDAFRGKFRNFLRGVIRNQSRNLLRRLRKNPAESWPDHFDVPGENQLDARFDREWRDFTAHYLLRLLKQNLPATHFQIFELLYLHGKTPRETAAFLQVPLPTVYSVRNRSMARLRLLRTLLEKF